MKKRYALSLIVLVCLGVAALLFKGSAFATDEVNPHGLNKVTGTAPVVVTSNTTTPNVSLPAATGSVDGYLTHTDWSTFSSRVNASRVVATTSPLSGGGDLSADRTLSIPQASSSVSGYLAAMDWATFNSRGSVGSATGAPAGAVLYSDGSSNLAGDPNLTWDPSVHGLKLSGSGVGYPGFVEFDDGGGVNYARLKAPNTITASYELQLPATTTGVTNGAGVEFVSGALAFTNAPVVSTEDLGTQFANTTGAHPAADVFCAAGDGNQDITGGSPTCDGLSPSGGRALLTAQTTTSQNGLWVINPFGAWARDPSFPDVSQCNGYLITVKSGGTTYGNTAWMAHCDSTTATFTQVPTAQTPNNVKAASNFGTCTVSSTTLSTTATNLTCSGVPASASIAVSCSGAAAMSVPTGDAVYCRATGTANQIACNTVVVNTTAMAFNCMWMRP